MKAIIKKLSTIDAWYIDKHLFEGKEMNQKNDGWWIFINKEDEEKAIKEKLYSSDGYCFYESDGFEIEKL